MEATVRPRAWKTVLAFAIIYLVWGSTFLAIRVGVREVPPLVFASMRFFTAGILLFGWLRLRGTPARLEEMVRTQDGFQIAELDLELRGPGEFFGTKQAGVPMFRVANLIRDRKLLELAKMEAAALVAGKSPNITEQDVTTVMDHLKNYWQRRYGLVEVG